MGRKNLLLQIQLGSKLFWFFFILLGSSCLSSHYKEGRFSKKQGNREIKYQIGVLPLSWEKVKNSEGDLVFRHRLKKATISANSQCQQDVDRPIDFVIDDLFSEFSGSSDSQVHELERKQIELSNQLQAFDLIVEIPWGHIMLKSEVVIVQQKDCIYDLQFISSPTDFVDLQKDFRFFYQGFIAGTEK